MEHVEGRDLRNAVIELQSFLADTRRRIRKYMTPEGALRQATDLNNHDEDGNLNAELDTLLFSTIACKESDRERTIYQVAVLVDTTLFRAYMYAQPSLAGSLFRISNSCDPVVVKEKLLENGRYNDLVDFFFGKGLHRDALELLMRFGQGQADEVTVPQLRGPERTVTYLQNLPPEMIDLILEFAEWPLRVNPDLGMEVFLADTENAETLPRDKVLRFLENIERQLAVRYLKHIIHELNDSTPEFHQRLIGLYLDRLKSQNYPNIADQNEAMRIFLDFLRQSRSYSAGKVLGLLPRGGDYCTRDPLRTTLIL